MFNTICNGCLVTGRKMEILDNNNKECYLEIVRKIPTYQSTSPSIQLCWECSALLSRFLKFKAQVINSYKALHEKVNIANLKTQTNLSIKQLYILNFDPDNINENETEVIKTEIKREVQQESEIKEEIDSYSNDDETPLIQFSKKRKRKKVINGHKKKTIDAIFSEVEISRDELKIEREVWADREEYVNAMFKCERCIMSFPNADDLMDHINNKHKVNALFKCDICECSFSTEVSYNYHTNKHIRRYQCAACGDRFTGKRAVTTHYNMVHCIGTEVDYSYQRPTQNGHALSKEGTETNGDSADAPMFPCEFCAKSFRWKTSLRKHLETHRIEAGQKRRPYCEPCKLSFKTTSNLQKHVKTSFKHQMQLKLWKLKENQPVEVEVTPEKQAAHLEQAVRSARRSRAQFPCAQCGKLFLWRGNLLRHLHSHAAKAKGELVCVPCNRNFSSIATYQQHMTISRKHVSEDQFKFMCSECGKRFVNKIRLKDHVNWEHLKNYEHKCTVCSKVFKSHTSLYLHKQAVHRKGSAEHLCDHCGKPFPSPAKLRGHMLAAHDGAAPLRCAECGARFAWHSCLSRHRRRVHRAPHT